MVGNHILVEVIRRKNENWYLLVVLNAPFTIVKMTDNCEEQQEELILKQQMQLNTNKCGIMLMRIFLLHFHSILHQKQEPRVQAPWDCQLCGTHIYSGWRDKGVGRLVLFYGANRLFLHLGLCRFLPPHPGRDKNNCEGFHREQLNSLGVLGLEKNTNMKLIEW